MDQKKREFLETLRKIDPANPIFINPFLSEEKKEEMIENGVNNYNFYGIRVDDIERNMEIKESDDEKTIQFKKRYKEIKEAWRKGETVVFDQIHTDEENTHVKESDKKDIETTASQTKKQKTNGKKGRPVTAFKDYFFKSDDAPKIIPILKKMVEGKHNRGAIRIIVACCFGGWISPPSAASIEREFGIPESSARAQLRCHFKPPEHSKPEYQPFTDAELSHIVDIIKKEIEIMEMRSVPPMTT